MLGAALLGYFITRLQERLPPSLYRRAFLGTGVCGALTTFSTVMVELVKMIEGGHLALAARLRRREPGRRLRGGLPVDQARASREAGAMSFVALWLAVGVLGGLGAIARFLLDALVSANAGARFPLGTLLVNLSGALVLGRARGARAQRRRLPARRARR